MITAEKITVKEAEELWGKSSQASAFSHPATLQILCKTVDWWATVKGNEVQCLWPVCLDQNNQVFVPDFTYYVGPFWQDAAYCIPNHRWLNRTTQVYEAFLNRFTLEYKSMVACLPPVLTDVRAFDWWKYGQSPEKRFQIRPRYTALISHLDQKTDASLLADFRTDRRQKIRSVETKKYDIAVSYECSLETLKYLYQLVFSRQSIVVTNETLASIEALYSLIGLKTAEVICLFQKEKIIGAMLLLYAKNTANVVLSLVSPQFREKGFGAYLIFNAIKRARQKGCERFDFNGANSPNRGDDKHSYGAEPLLFFSISCTNLSL